MELPRPDLYDRINRRVRSFFDSGLIEEVRALQAGARPLSPVAAQAIGYREVTAMLAGQATLDETIDRIQTRSRQFAKRQATWFRGLEEVARSPLRRKKMPRPSPAGWHGKWQETPRTSTISARSVPRHWRAISSLLYSLVRGQFAIGFLQVHVKTTTSIPGSPSFHIREESVATARRFGYL